jgi:oligo-1,6-glucosidase
MHWDSGPNAGFSTGSPWIMLNPNYREINAEEQIRRNDSIFSFYQTLIQLRKKMDIITLGNFELLIPDDPDLFVYTRRYRGEELLVVCNFSPKERVFTPPERFTDAQLLLSNDKAAALEAVDCKALEPFEAVVYYQITDNK